MGFTGTILAAKPSAAADVGRTLAAFDFHEPESVNDGWVIDEAHRHPGHAVDYFVSLLAEMGGPVLVAEVFDSDIAYLAAGTPDLEPFVLVLTPKALRAEGVPLPSSGEQRRTLEAFAKWSSVAPRGITGARLRELIKAGNTFAEATVWELLGELRIRPLPDSDEAPARDVAEIRRIAADDFVGYVKPLSWMGTDVSYRGRGIPWADYRFVPGRGEDFYGVWDRAHGGKPLLTYPKSLKGHENLLADFGDLDARLDHADIVDQFDGLIGVLADDLYAGGRELRLQDSRYVPGWGLGFSGVWEREGPREAVVRFKGGAAGRRKAKRWVGRTMLPILAQAKVVGPDRWISRLLDDPYDTSGTSKAALWLLAYEEADPSWPPHGSQEMERDGYVLQQVVKLDHGFDIQAGFGLAEADVHAAMHAASHWGSRGDWIPVSDQVPLNLLATARWAVEDSPYASSLVPYPTSGR
jgi:hypothetical protein